MISKWTNLACAIWLCRKPKDNLLGKILRGTTNKNASCYTLQVKGQS